MVLISNHDEDEFLRSKCNECARMKRKEYLNRTQFYCEAKKKFWNKGMDYNCIEFRVDPYKFCH